MHQAVDSRRLVEPRARGVLPRHAIERDACRVPAQPAVCLDCERAPFVLLRAAWRSSQASARAVAHAAPSRRRRRWRRAWHGGCPRDLVPGPRRAPRRGPMRRTLAAASRGRPGRQGAPVIAVRRGSHDASPLSASNARVLAGVLDWAAARTLTRKAGTSPVSYNGLSSMTSPHSIAAGALPESSAGPHRGGVQGQPGQAWRRPPGTGLPGAHRPSHARARPARVATACRPAPAPHDARWPRTTSLAKAGRTARSGRRSAAGTPPVDDGAGREPREVSHSSLSSSSRMRARAASVAIAPPLATVASTPRR